LIGMKIVIMRHGEAEPSAATDAERNLTAVGRRQAERAGQRLQALGFRPDKILVSPYHRAQQTCEAVLTAFPLATQGVVQHTVAMLEPESDPAEIIATINQAADNNLLLISHQPLVSKLVGLLAEGNMRSGPPIAPASMVMLSGDSAARACMDLQWVRHAPDFEDSH
jgi:phosphohistidine phosphatase